jgi:hypothetical protein
VPRRRPATVVGPAVAGGGAAAGCQTATGNHNSCARPAFQVVMQAQNGSTIAWLVAICVIAGLLAAVVSPGV